MYCFFDDTNGFPPRVYRTPERVRADIREISARISEVNEKLNIRELLSEFLNGETENEPLEKRAEDLTELLAYATEALGELRELNATLDTLKEELVATAAVCKSI